MTGILTFTSVRKLKHKNKPLVAIRLRTGVPAS